MGKILSFLAVCFACMATAAQVPATQHVFVVLEENHGYSSVLGSPSMPYLNSLAHTYSYAANYYADTHPSIGNYFMLTTGQIITNNDAFSGVVSADNLARHFAATGKTWKVYAESLPYTGYLGGDTGSYFRHHNPFSYFSDVQASTAARDHLVPYSQLQSDLKYNTLPDFAFIIPNACDDAHNCSLATADAWLKSHIAPVLASPYFNRSGLLLIAFDEAAPTDTAHGGGHVVTVAAGTHVKRGYHSNTFYQHQNLLKTVCSALQLYGCPGAGNSAAPMAALF